MSIPHFTYTFGLPETIGDGGCGGNIGHPLCMSIILAIFLPLRIHVPEHIIIVELWLVLDVKNAAGLLLIKVFGEPFNIIAPHEQKSPTLATF
jgi:hypothetical protein